MTKQNRQDLDSETHNKAADKNTAEKINTEKSKTPEIKTEKRKAVGGDCKRCEKVCPMLNIVMVGWKPVWGADCTSCLACYHVCPQKAVQYGKATKKKGQYFNPNVK